MGNNLKPLLKSGEKKWKKLKEINDGRFISHQERMIEETFKRKYLEEGSCHFLVSRTVKVSDAEIRTIIKRYVEDGWTIQLGPSSIVFRRPVGLDISEKRFVETERYAKLVKEEEKRNLKYAKMRDEMACLITFLPDTLLYSILCYLRKKVKGLGAEDTPESGK